MYLASILVSGPTRLPGRGARPLHSQGGDTGDGICCRHDQLAVLVRTLLRLVSLIAHGKSLFPLSQRVETAIITPSLSHQEP